MGNSSLFVILFLIVLWYVLLRRRATRMDSKADFEGLVAGGLPVVADFFSNT